MNYTYFLFFAISFSSVNQLLGSVLSSSGTILNPHCPDVRLNREKSMIYYGSENFAMPIPDGFKDACWIGNHNKEFSNSIVIRQEKKDGVTFGLWQQAGVRNSIESINNDMLPYNQKAVIGQWGVCAYSNKILLGWIEFLVKNKSDKNIKKILLSDLLEELSNKTDDFDDVVTSLKIFDLCPKSLKYKALDGQFPFTIPLKNFPLDTRILLFPRKILFSPDACNVIIQTENGFAVQSILPGYPQKGAEIFSFNYSSNQTGQNDQSLELNQSTVIKWITNDQFLVLVYTNIVKVILSYSKQGPAWWSDKMPSPIVAAINTNIIKLSNSLLQLRFGELTSKNKVPLFGLFCGVGFEQLLKNIPLSGNAGESKH